MGLTQLYHRAFRDFRKHTQPEPESQKLRKTIRRSNQTEDVLTSIKYDCIIEPDWVENIEEGLVYVEKAIQEERQFIRTEGEVIPIEKVKRVSKASVEHLAKHSDLITRVPKDKRANLIPEKLYMEEKLTDYQVYENRFLYMLLCYLKDFIQLRLDDIKDKTTTFEAKVTMNKNLDENQRHLKYGLNYHDLYKNDPYLIDQYRKIPMVDRIENIYALVVSFLSHPLMKEVSKAPKIKPPVIKINVLRMNPNFRAALKLYDYVTAYNKDGYTIEEKKQSLNPFPKAIGDEIAETIQLTSNLAYIVGNDLSKTLEEQLKAREAEEKALQEKKHIDELKRLKKRIVEMNEDASEYMLRLEKRNVELEKKGLELKAEQEKNEALQERVKTLETDKQSLKDTIKQLKAKLKAKDDELNAMNQKYFDDMTESEEVHQREIKALKEKHAAEIETLKTHYENRISDLKTHYETTISELKSEHEAALQALKTSYEKTIQSLKDSYETEIETLKETHASTLQAMKDEHEENLHTLKETHEKDKQAQRETHEKEKAELNALIAKREEAIEEHKHAHEVLSHKHEQSIKAHEKQRQTLNKKIKRLDEEKKYESAKIKALKNQHGLMDDADYTSKQKFRQLEMEMEAYKKLFKEQWKKAKSQIRQKVKEETFNDDSSDRQN